MAECDAVSCETLSLTTDMWSDRSMRSVDALTLHYATDVVREIIAKQCKQACANIEAALGEYTSAIRQEELEEVRTVVSRFRVFITKFHQSLIPCLWTIGEDLRDHEPCSTTAPQQRSIGEREIELSRVQEIGDDTPHDCAIGDDADGDSDEPDRDGFKPEPQQISPWRHHREQLESHPLDCGTGAIAAVCAAYVKRLFAAKKADAAVAAMRVRFRVQRIRCEEEADTGVAAVLMCYRTLRQEPTNAQRENGELFEEAVATVKKEFDQQRLFVQQHVTDQVKCQFDALVKMPRHDHQSPTLSLSGFDMETDKKKGVVTETDWLRQQLGYSLTVEASSIDGAGEGVKLNGRLPIGSVVALFPGTVYAPEHLKKPQYLREVSNNVYARARFDSVIIDAKNEATPPRNPFAVAHKINHPPTGSKPNVMPFAFDFPPEEPFTTPEYQRLIPNSFVEMPSRLSMFGKRALVHGLTFISTADIEDGDELFLNYRYNPNNTLPEWYTSVDADADRKMWQ